MLQVELVTLPHYAKWEDIHNRAVVVLDVLRATTSMIAALHAGATEIRVFDSLDAARTAAHSAAPQHLLCGEAECRKPSDFDLGNSPGDFTAEVVAGRTMFMSTTNGTRAILAVRDAGLILIGALVNAAAVARALAGQDRPVMLVCAGTNGQRALEDELGAGAILHHLQLAGCVGPTRGGDEFERAQNALPEVLRATQGGMNITAAGLAPDIDFAARVNAFDVVGLVRTSEDDQIAVHRYVSPV